MKSKLIGIAVKPQRMQAMQPVGAGELSTDAGLVGDCRGRPGPRQLTLLSLTAWRAACDEIGVELVWTERRANLLVEDLAFYESTGACIAIGSALLEITGETDPCSRMAAVHPSLRNAMTPDWRGGVCCRVLRGGAIALGMAVELIPASNAELLKY